MSCTKRIPTPEVDLRTGGVGSPVSAVRRRKRAAAITLAIPSVPPQAIIKAVEAKDAPLRLLLGKPALDLAYKELETQKGNFDAWAETTAPARPYPIPRPAPDTPTIAPIS
jgi:hypothetical protein